MATALTSASPDADGAVLIGVTRATEAALIRRGLAYAVYGRREIRSRRGTYRGTDYHAWTGSRLTDAGRTLRAELVPAILLRNI